MPRVLGSSQSHSYLLGSPPEVLPTTTQQAAAANNVSIRTASTRKPQLKPTSFSRVSSAPVDSPFDTPPMQPKRSAPKRIVSAYRAAERGKGDILPTTTAASTRPLGPSRVRSMSSTMIQQQHQQQQHQQQQPQQETWSDRTESFVTRTLRSRSSAGIKRFSDCDASSNSAGAMDWSNSRYSTMELPRHTMSNSRSYYNNHDYKHRKHRGVFRPPANFFQMLTVLLVTCIVWESYRRALSTMEQFDKLKHDESILLLHLHKMEKISVSLGEVLERINTDAAPGAAPVANDSAAASAAADTSKQEPVDAEITRINIAQLKQMEAELQNELGSLQIKLQTDARNSIVKAFGEGPIQITLDLDLGDGNKASISVALAYDTPYAAWTLIDQVQRGQWTGSKLHWDKGLTISAVQPNAKPGSQLDFVERSTEEHKPWTVGLTDTPGGGLTLFVNLKDNSMQRKNDVCVGKVVESSFGDLQKLVASARTLDGSHQDVTIKAASASRMSRGKSFFE